MAANAAQLGFWQRDLVNDAMWLSDHARRLYGLALDVPVTLATVTAIKHVDDRDRVRAAVQAAIDAHSEFEVEFRAVWPNGETRWLRQRGSVRLDESGRATHLTGVLVDVTERKRLALAAEEERKELAHLSRVAMVGELSTALAHELAQPLGAILSNAQAAKQLLAMEPRDIPQLDEILDDIVRDDSRAADVIRQLRVLIKKADPVFQPLRVATLAGEALSIVRSELLARRVAVTTDFAPSLPSVTGDRVQLLQVLLNLILNACDAMQDVPAARPSVDAECAGRRRRSGDRVRLRQRHRHRGRSDSRRCSSRSSRRSPPGSDSASRSVARSSTRTRDVCGRRTTRMAARSFTSRCPCAPRSAQEPVYPTAGTAHHEALQ